MKSEDGPSLHGDTRCLIEENERLRSELERRPGLEEVGLDPLRRSLL